MDAKKLALAIISGLNALVTELEELISEATDEGGEEEERSSRSRTKKKTAKKKTSRRRRDEEEEEEEEEDEGEEEESDEPSEDEIVDAVRAAQKVLETADVKKLMKKHGKADRATLIKPELRQAVIDALSEAVDEAG